MSFHEIHRTAEDRYQQSSGSDGRENIRNYTPSLLKQIEELIDLQERLVESREKLLIKREKARTSAKRVQSKRLQTGNVEADFMDGLRKFMYETGQQLPVALFDAHAKLEATRNSFAVLEDNYLQAERDLTGTEWLFIDEENDFYQFDLRKLLVDSIGRASSPEKTAGHAKPLTSIPPPPPPPPPPTPSQFRTPDVSDISLSLSPPLPPPPHPPPSPSSPITFHSQDTPSMVANRTIGLVTNEIGNLKKRFDALREEQLKRLEISDSDRMPEKGDGAIDPDSPGFTAAYFNVLKQMSLREVEAQRLKQEDMQHELQASLIGRRHSDPSHAIAPAQMSFDLISIACTESAVDALSRDPMAQQRIRDWLLEYREGTYVERTLCSNLLRDSGVDEPEDDTWKGFVMRGRPIPGSNIITDESRDEALSDDDMSDVRDTESLYDPMIQDGVSPSERLYQQSSCDEINTEDYANLTTDLPDAIIDPSFVPLPASTISEGNLSCPTGIRAPIIYVHEPEPPWINGIDYVRTSTKEGDSNELLSIATDATIRHLPRTDSGCDVHIGNNHGHTHAQRDVLLSESDHGYGYMDTMRLSSSEFPPNSPVIIATDFDFPHAITPSIPQGDLARDNGQMSSSYIKSSDLRHDKLAWSSHNGAAFQCVQIHITPPSPPLSRPKSERGCRSRLGQLRGLFARGRHQRSRSTPAAFGSNGAEYTMDHHSD